jgi:hypothetical protein
MVQHARAEEWEGIFERWLEPFLTALTRPLQSLRLRRAVMPALRR